MPDFALSSGTLVSGRIKKTSKTRAGEGPKSWAPTLGETIVSILLSEGWFRVWGSDLAQPPLIKKIVSILVVAKKGPHNHP